MFVVSYLASVEGSFLKSFFGYVACENVRTSKSTNCEDKYHVYTLKEEAQINFVHDCQCSNNNNARRTHGMIISRLSAYSFNRVLCDF